MKKRADRQQDFEQVKTDLFEAGLSVVKAAKAHEEMFHTSLEALTEAYEAVGDSEANLPALAAAPNASAPSESMDTTLLIQLLQRQQQAAIATQSVDAYLAATETLLRLKTIVVEEIELTARRLEAEIRITTARQQLEPLPNVPEPTRRAWTEAELRQEYKKLEKVRQVFGIEARTWQVAIDQVNQARRANS